MKAEKLNKWDMLVIVVAVALFIYAAVTLKAVYLAFYAAVTLLMLYVSYTDIHYRKIRTKGMYVLILLGIFSMWLYPIGLAERLLTVVMVGGSLIATMLFSDKVLGVKKSVGAGDFRILVYSGLMFGYLQIYVIAIASVLTLLFSVFAVVVSGGKLKSVPGYRICLGPFVAFAICFMLLFVLKASM